MFTGLIQDVGRVVEVSPGRGSVRFGIHTKFPVGQMRDGESVAVDGVCLTVVRRRGTRFYADAVKETLERSTLRDLRPGRRVNLERSLRLGDALDGHLVAGHVDDTVRILELTRRGDDVRLRVELPRDLARYVARKGSVALHGISLTVAALGSDHLEVVLVPATLAKTTLGEARVGERLNVEVDLLARYLERMIGATADPGRPAGGPSPPWMTDRT